MAARASMRRKAAVVEARRHERWRLRSWALMELMARVTDGLAIDIP